MAQAKFPDKYKGYKIERVNEGHRGYLNPEIRVKYGIIHNGVNVWFTTQKDLQIFIDKEVG